MGAQHPGAIVISKPKRIDWVNWKSLTGRRSLAADMKCLIDLSLTRQYNIIILLYYFIKERRDSKVVFFSEDINVERRCLNLVCFDLNITGILKNFS